MEKQLSYRIERATPRQVIDGRILSGEEFIVRFLDCEGGFVDSDYFETEEQAILSGANWVLSQ